MTRRKQAMIVLESLDKLAPTNINWNNAEIWLQAIEDGLAAVEKAETPAAGTAGESR